MTTNVKTVKANLTLMNKTGNFTVLKTGNFTSYSTTVATIYKDHKG